MHLLKQSTAATVIVGPVLDSAGAAVTTAVVGDFRLAKEGTSAVLSGATVTHDANGYYLVALTTTNTNTVGRLAIYSNNTAQSMGTTRFMVLLPSVYDALVTNAVNTSGGLPSATGNITALAGAISTFAGGAVASVTAGVTVTTNNDKTGYSLTQAFPANFSSLAITVGGAVTAGTVSDKTGYSLTQTFPTHFNDLVISANGHVTATVDAINNNTITASAIQGGAITAAKFATDAIAAAAVSADAVTKIQAGLATATTQTTILDRLGAFTGSGVNTVLGFLKALGSKAATTPSDMGGTYSAATDATEAIRDAMQAGTGDASQATLLAVQATVDAVAASLSGSSVEVVSRVADGGSITLFAGDDMRVRSGTEVSVTVTDVGGVIYTRLDTLGVANLAFGAARPSQTAGAITGTISSLSQAGSGASQTCTIVIEIVDGGLGLATADNYVWQVVSSEQHGAEYDTYTEVEGSLSVRRRVAVPVYS
jgi:hypothetical protein